MIGNQQLYNTIVKYIGEDRIYKDEPMCKHTSFKVGGNADFFIKVNNIEELKYLIKIANENSIKVTIIGNGSNILVKDKGIRGFVLKLEFTDIYIEKEMNSNNEVIISVGSGVKMGQLAQNLLKQEIEGFEFASGIPRNNRPELLE